MGFLGLHEAPAHLPPDRAWSFLRESDREERHQRAESGSVQEGEKGKREKGKSDVKM
jgi:hypothetical protein